MELKVFGSSHGLLAQGPYRQRGSPCPVDENPAGAAAGSFCRVFCPAVGALVQLRRACAAQRLKMRDLSLRSLRDAREAIRQCLRENRTMPVLQALPEERKPPFFSSLFCRIDQTGPCFLVWSQESVSLNQERIGSYLLFWLSVRVIVKSASEEAKQPVPCSALGRIPFNRFWTPWPAWKWSQEGLGQKMLSTPWRTRGLVKDVMPSPRSNH